MFFSGSEGIFVGVLWYRRVGLHQGIERLCERLHHASRQDGRRDAKILSCKSPLSLGGITMKITSNIVRLGSITFAAARARGFIAAMSLVGLAAFSSTTASAGSVSGSDTWAGDYGLLALPTGTAVFVEYAGYQHGANFIDTTGTSQGGSANIYTNILRGAYLTNFLGHPLALEAALPYASVQNASITNGVAPIIAPGAQTSGSGFFSPVLFIDYGLIVDNKADRLLAVTNYVYLPVGAYNDTVTINPGTAHQTVWVPQIGYSEGLSKFGLPKGIWFDLIANMSFHSNGTETPAVNPLNPALNYANVSQANSYDIQGFLRYETGPLGHIAIGIEKSWGGLQTLSGGTLGAFVGPFNTSADNYTRAHLQITKAVMPDLQLGIDLKHDFQTVGGYKEDFGVEFRLVKLFVNTPPPKPNMYTK